jgi:hypothetical protein
MYIYIDMHIYISNTSQFNYSICFAKNIFINYIILAFMGPNESVPTYLCFLFPGMVIIQNHYFLHPICSCFNLVDSASTFAHWQSKECWKSLILHDAGRKHKLFLTVKISGPNIHGSKLPDHHGDAQCGPIPSCSVTTW